MVGFTTDHRGLIFSVRRGAKSGGFVINLDDSVINAVEELRALIAEEEAAKADAKASPKRPESSLSVREVQQRLRRGRTIEQVAREAGVDPSWVSRFAVPIQAEQAEIIRAARATRMNKQRVGLSGAALGDSVYRNLAERGFADPREQLEKSWRARQLTEGMWLVSLKYTVRGRESEAQWEYDETAGTLRARGRLGTQLGFREPTRRAAKAAAASTPATRARGSAKKKAAPSKPTPTARKAPSRQSAKRVAAARRAAAARMVSEAEKATRRNAALARKASKKPVVLPPRQPVEPLPPLEPLLPDDELDEPAGWGDELDLVWDDDDAVDDAAPEDEVEVDLEGQEADEAEVEVDVEAVEAPAEPAARRRREPLRARTQEEASSPADRARRQVRLRSSAASEGDDTGNGPVFRSDLAQPVSELPSFPRSTAGPTPAPPLSPPFKPIEPPPRRRRLRPLRGR
jgi:Protein of unknown function (DUF3071)